MRLATTKLTDFRCAWPMQEEQTQAASHAFAQVIAQAPPKLADELPRRAAVPTLAHAAHAAVVASLSEQHAHEHAALDAAHAAECFMLRCKA